MRPSRLRGEVDAGERRDVRRSARDAGGRPSGTTRSRCSCARRTRTWACSATRSTARATAAWSPTWPRTCCCSSGTRRGRRELAAIAGYLHDIGNGINRLDHGIGAALLSRHILERLGMGPDEYAEVMVAIGNHEEEYGQAVSPLAAAVILGDKSDVHRSRVRVLDLETDDIHDRVNMATTRSVLERRPGGAHHHAGAGDRHRHHPGDAVLRDLPRPHGHVPPGGGVPGVQVRDRDQRDAPALREATERVR